MNLGHPPDRSNFEFNAEGSASASSTSAPTSASNSRSPNRNAAGGSSALSAEPPTGTVTAAPSGVAKSVGQTLAPKDLAVSHDSPKDLAGDPLRRRDHRVASRALESKRPQSGSFYLGVFDDHLRGVPVFDGTLLIGRSKHNHLQLHDHLLSRKHCSLHRDGDRLTLVDLNSSNGTYVNGERIASQQLQLDDIVELGKTVLVVYDGETWGQGQGLMNLRNPLKAQELVQRLGDAGLPEVAPRRLKKDGSGKNGSHGGVRARKGLLPEERGFLQSLAQQENELLPQLVTEYLTHKLVSLLVRNSKPVRSAFTAVLEEMLRPEFFGRFDNTAQLRETVAALVDRELGDLRRGETSDLEVSALEDRGLLEDPRTDGDDDVATTAAPGKPQE